MQKRVRFNEGDDAQFQSGEDSEDGRIGGEGGGEKSGLGQADEFDEYVKVSKHLRM